MTIRINRIHKSMIAKTLWVPNTNKVELSQLRRDSGNVTCFKSTWQRFTMRLKAVHPSRCPIRPVQSSSTINFALSVPGGGHGNRSHSNIGSRMYSGAERHLSHFWHLGHVSTASLPAILHRRLWKTDDTNVKRA